MFTIVVRPLLPRPWIRIVILIVILLVTSRLAPVAVTPLALGSWLGWLTSQPEPAGTPRPVLAAGGTA
jgi:hypothetical protein